jgi:nucleoside-diphosphate-sugar epimerase
MRVIVTGGTGFIGCGLVLELLARSHQVLQIGRSANNLPSGAAEYLQADLSQPATYADALSAFQPEAAVHLAWEGIPDFSRAQCERNLSMSVRFLDTLMAIGSCRKIIGTGSCWEYGLQEGPCLESATPAVTNDFTRAKDFIRQHGMIKAAQTGKSFGWFRIFFVYGPSQRKGSLIPSAIEAWRRHENAPPKNPRAAQDFIYLGDVVEALARAVEVDWPSGVYNLGTGSLTSVADIVRMVRELMNDPATETAPVGRQETGGIWASTEQARLHLQWQSRTSVTEGLRKTVAEELRP